MKSKQNKAKGSWQPLHWIYFLILYCFDFDKLMISDGKMQPVLQLWSHHVHHAELHYFSGSLEGGWEQMISQHQIASVGACSKRLQTEHSTIPKNISRRGKVCLLGRHGSILAPFCLWRKGCCQPGCRTCKERSMLPSIPHRFVS